MSDSRVGNLGYLAIKKAITKDIAVTPDVYVPYFSESMNTDMRFDDLEAVMGNKAARQDLLAGQRNHTGQIEVLAEPDSASRFFDMLLKKGNPTGASDPYTHPFTLSSDNPAAYTFDIAKANIIERFIGCEISEINPTFVDNIMHFVLKVSARKSFIIREIASINTTEITLKTNYDPNPTNGLVAGDLVQIIDDAGSTATLETTVVSVDSDTVLTLGASAAAFAAGDLIALRKATPSYSYETPFSWARTEFRFGADAAAALSATHTPLEQGSTWKIIHSLKEDGGELRSGAYDPAELIRTLGDAELSIQIIHDDEESLNNFNTLAKKACVVRHFSEATDGTEHELRITLNNLKQRANERPTEHGSVVFQEIEFAPTYDTSDGQMFDVAVLNTLSSI